MRETTTAVRAMPLVEDDDAAWLAWATSYPTLVAINLTCVALGPASGTFSLESAPFPENPNGAVNGGFVALAADQVMGILGARSAQPGSVPVTAVLNTQFHLPAYAPLILHGSVIASGRSVQTIEVVVTNRDGGRAATATGTMYVGSPDRRERIGA